MHPSQFRWELLSNFRCAASVQSAGLQGEGRAPCSRAPLASRDMDGSRWSKCQAKAKVKLFGTIVTLAAGMSSIRVCLEGMRSKAKSVLFQLERVRFQKEPLSSF